MCRDGRYGPVHRCSWKRSSWPLSPQLRKGSVPMLCSVIGRGDAGLSSQAGIYQLEFYSTDQ